MLRDRCDRRAAQRGPAGGESEHRVAKTGRGFPLQEDHGGPQCREQPGADTGEQRLNQRVGLYEPIGQAGFPSAGIGANNAAYLEVKEEDVENRLAHAEPRRREPYNPVVFP